MSRTEKIITTEEAKLQVEYIKKLRPYLEGQKAKLGRPLFYTAVTFGCPNVTAVGIFKPLIINGLYKRTFVLVHS